MIIGKTLTGQEAIEQHPTTSLTGRQCVVITSMLGNSSAELHIGEIVDPADCVIDEPDDALFYVEYQKGDDFYLESVFEDTPIVLLSEVSNG
jgi:hypothetical protein